MNRHLLYDNIESAYSGIHLDEPLENVIGRGRRIRRARTARRAALALLSAAAVAVVVAVVPGGADGQDLAPIRLVSYEPPTFPLALTEVPAGLAPPKFSLDPAMDKTGPGVAHATYLQQDDPDSRDRVWLNVHVEAEPDNLGAAVGETTVNGRDAGLYEDSIDGSPLLTVVWRLDEDWVTLTGSGRYADRRTVEELARSVIRRPTPVPLHLKLAPAGWEVLAYKDNSILTLVDPASGEPPRTLTVHLPEKRTEPSDLARTVEGVDGQVRQIVVHDQPAHLVPTHHGWYLQAALPDGAPFVLQAPKAMTADQVASVAHGVTRSR